MAGVVVDKRSSGMKRSFEALAMSDASSGGAALEEGGTPAEGTVPTWRRATRRRRLVSPTVADDVEPVDAQENTGAPSATPPSETSEEPTSPAHSSTSSVDSSVGLQQRGASSFKPPRRLRERLRRAAASPSQPCLCTDDVREIVFNAAVDNETRLREKFAHVLDERLAEQFRSFSHFNRDYLFRVFREPQKNYVS